MSYILKQRFLEFIKNTKTTLSKKNKDELRIASYNIHFMTDVYEKINTYTGILDDIKKIDANFIGLEEFILGNIVKINDELYIDLNNFYEDIESLGYNKSIICNSVPSWFSAIYGNILLVKNYCSDTICGKLDETIYTYAKSTKTTLVSGTHEGVRETRCFIKVKIKYGNYTIHLYTTHLDVASEETRTEQIAFIIKDSLQFNQKNDVVFIMGDFNTINAEEMDRINPSWKTNKFLKDNGLVIRTLLENGFRDCHAENPALMTAWSNIRVDFIFCNKQMSGPFRAEYYMTDNSDHIPVILTITPHTRFL